MLRQINIDRELVRLYGDQARFRGRQQKAVDAIITNKSPIIVIIGTGMGKSLYFILLAASYPGGISIIIMPLVSLLGDIMA